MMLVNALLGAVSAITGWISGKGRGLFGVFITTLAAIASFRHGWCLVPLIITFAFSSAWDTRTMEVPVWPFVFSGVAYFATGGIAPLLEGVVGAAAGALFGYAVKKIGQIAFQKDGYGEGDIVLAGIAGLFLGAQRLFVGMAAAGIIALLYMWAAGRKNPEILSQPFAFVPFLSIGLLLGAIF